MQLDELNRIIPWRHGFDNSERSYSSAVSWARCKLGCNPQKKLMKKEYDKNYYLKNKDKIKERRNSENYKQLRNESRQRYAYKNTEKVQVYNKDYYQKNKERLGKKNRDYNRMNKEKCIEYIVPN
ncbi:unnamed protein product [Meloidogyne enterolobii]|uniref:Uncharacterized protein n=1 Tax=Meloidogyne enterolobii TaxID=390850 RepID=A0ACB0XTU4_MELEN